jgi:poly-beta-1,6-N-acetyl-D-glucosamine synthase
MVHVVLYVFLLYFLLMILLLEGWRKAIRQTSRQRVGEESTPFISVIIPIRNEQENIVNLLNGIDRQNYPSEKFEVIMVNDHSEDNTQDVVEKWRAQNSRANFRFINLTTPVTGKKAAITEGVKSAVGDIIVTTDADAAVGTGWLIATAALFQPSVKMVCGAVRILPGKSFFGEGQAMEFASLIGTGAATLALGIPTMCNGANLAFRKSAFEEVGGYAGNAHIPSGDDEFLLRKIIQRYPKGVDFNRNTESVVSVEALTSLQEFFMQRVRWAGKWRAHGARASAFLAVFIFLFYVFVLSVLPLTVLGVLSVGDAGLLLGGKLIIEGVFLFEVSKFLSVRFNGLSFLTLQFVYPLYVVFFALAASFLTVSWKGRKI